MPNCEKTILFYMCRPTCMLGISWELPCTIKKTVNIESASCTAACAYNTINLNNLKVCDIIQCLHSQQRWRWFCWTTTEQYGAQSPLSDCYLGRCEPPGSHSSPSWDPRQRWDGGLPSYKVCNVWGWYILSWSRSLGPKLLEYEKKKKRKKKRNTSVSD